MFFDITTEYGSNKQLSSWLMPFEIFQYLHFKTSPCLIFYSCSSRKELTKAFLVDNPRFHHVILFITITLAGSLTLARWFMPPQQDDNCNINVRGASMFMPVMAYCVAGYWQRLSRGLDWDKVEGQGCGDRKGKGHTNPHLSLITFDYFAQRNCLFCSRNAWWIDATTNWTCVGPPSSSSACRI